MVKTITGKPDVITEVDQSKGSTSEITQENKIPLSTLLTYLKSGDSIQQQAFHGMYFRTLDNMWSRAWQYEK